MKLNLTRPLVIFDLETTGLDIATARIIQISYIIARPDGSEERNNLFVNPEMPIPQEVQQLTGINDDMVKDAKTFKELAPTLAQEFKGCDFAGFNSNYYDLPLLCEEFLRAGINFDFSKAHFIDSCSIFKKMERRNLAAAYKFYCGRRMEDDFQAHLADQDTEATWRVLQAQLDMYAPGRQEEKERQLENSIEALEAASRTGQPSVDFAGRLVYDEEGNEVVNFGKYKGVKISDVFQRDPGYYGWIQQADFTRNTKQEFTRLWLKYAKR
ncbi:MAG: 3'-5' exonuclease [Bacteroidaceae bacterium]|nr:3'-5' exonuclease [Bacteroidaceae bacterium]